MARITNEAKRSFPSAFEDRSRDGMRRRKIIAWRFPTAQLGSGIDNGEYPMQAIEFEAHLKDGVIQLPPAYQHWREDQPVKVIVLATDNVVSRNKDIKDINRHAGKISLTEDPLAFQGTMRDEWR